MMKWKRGWCDISIEFDKYRVRSKSKQQSDDESSSLVYITMTMIMMRMRTMETLMNGKKCHLSQCQQHQCLQKLALLLNHLTITSAKFWQNQKKGDFQHRQGEALQQGHRTDRTGLCLCHVMRFPISSGSDLWPSVQSFSTIERLPSQEEAVFDLWPPVGHMCRPGQSSLPLLENIHKRGIAMDSLH